MILPMHSDINECVLDIYNDCDENAECNNTVGGFNCTCDPGYMGNGTMCAGIVISASIISVQCSYMCRCLTLNVVLYKILLCIQMLMSVQHG